MKNYALSCLLSVRKISQQQALIELSKAKERHQREASAQRKIDEDLRQNKELRQNSKTAIIDKFKAVSNGCRFLGLINDYEQHLLAEEAQLKKAQARQKIIVEHAIGNENERRANYFVTQKETKIIEKHREKWWMMEQTIQQQKAEKALDDFNATRFTLRLKS